MSIEQYALSDYLRAFRRRAKLVAPVFLVIAGTAVAVATLLPDVYRSSAEFEVDLRGASQLQPVEITNYADQYISSLQRRVLSTENRRRWLQESNLYADERGEMEEGELIARMREGASVQLVMTSVRQPGRDSEVDLVTGFRAIFEAGDPESAYFVADKMAETFLAADRQERTGRASTTTDFLENEIEQKRQEISEIESRIADFKEENAGMLPDMRSFNMSSLERAENELEATESEISTAEQDMIFRQAQIEEARRRSPSAERLETLEEEYLRAVSIYGADHPDVLRIRRQVDALTGGAGSDEGPEVAQLEAELAALRERYSEEHPDVANARRRLETLREQQPQTPGREPTDVRYLEQSAQVNALERRLQGLRQRADELRSRIDRMEGRLARTPQVERESQALQRELETAQLTFDDLRTRASQARQTEAFESGDLGARIELVNGASIPRQPSGPPRTAIIMLGMFLATTFGVGVGLGSEAMDATIRGSKDIRSLLQTRPIAAIPVVENSVLRAERRRKFVMNAIATGAIVAILLAVYSSIS